jgi:hypothetical protein
MYWPQPCLINVVGYLFIFAGTCSCVFLKTANVLLTYSEYNLYIFLNVVSIRLM